MTLKKWGLTLASFFVFIVGILFWPGSGRTSVEIIVEPGDSAHKIVKTVVVAGHLKTRYPFLAWVKIRGAGTKIKVGRYLVNSGRSAFWIVDDLVHGRTQKIRVPIPEGFASWQIAERLALFRICNAEKFKAVVAQRNLEGYLFPATYELDYAMGAESVVKILTNQFDRIWTDDMSLRTEELGWTQHQVLTMASIIQREIMIHEEMPLVSAVYHNRVRKNMKLEADPTVQFALGYWKKRLLFADLRKTDSPYNTYKYKGLPPGPICSPGRDAIIAALWPAESDALFFVANEDGTHNFSRTYAEHLRKVKKRNARRRKAR